MGKSVRKDPLGILTPTASSTEQADPLGILKKKETTTPTSSNGAATPSPTPTQLGLRGVLSEDQYKDKVLGKNNVKFQSFYQDAKQGRDDGYLYSQAEGIAKDINSQTAQQLSTDDIFKKLKEEVSLIDKKANKPLVYAPTGEENAARNVSRSQGNKKILTAGKELIDEKIYEDKQKIAIEFQHAKDVETVNSWMQQPTNNPVADFRSAGQGDISQLVKPETPLNNQSNEVQRALHSLVTKGGLTLEESKKIMVDDAEKYANEFNSEFNMDEEGNIQRYNEDRFANDLKTGRLSYEKGRLTKNIDSPIEGAKESLKESLYAYKAKMAQVALNSPDEKTRRSGIYQLNQLAEEKKKEIPVNTEGAGSVGHLGAGIAPYIGASILTGGGAAAMGASGLVDAATTSGGNALNIWMGEGADEEKIAKINASNDMSVASGFLRGAALGGKLPNEVIPRFLQSAEKILGKVPSSALKVGGVFGAAQIPANIASKQAGYDVGIVENVPQSFWDGFKMDMGMQAFHGAFAGAKKLVGMEAAGVKKNSPEYKEMDAAYKDMVATAAMTEARAEDVLGDNPQAKEVINHVNELKDINDQLPNDIKPEQRFEVLRNILDRKDLEAKAEATKDTTLKSMYNEQAKKKEEQIQELLHPEIKVENDVKEIEDAKKVDLKEIDLKIKSLDPTDKTYEANKQRFEQQKVEIEKTYAEQIKFVKDGHVRVSGDELKELQPKKNEKEISQEPTIKTDEGTTINNESVASKESIVTETSTPKDTQAAVQVNKSDADIEKRMAEIEGDSNYKEEFNSLEKEMESRERKGVFNVPLDKVNEAVDGLMKKDKEMPNGFGSFIDKRDAKETKEVADRYLDATSLTDREVKKDFIDSLMGNPDKWYADGLKLRESLKEATARGINTKDLINEAVQVFTKDGYDENTAKKVIVNLLKPIFEGSQKVETNESKQLETPPPKEETPLPTGGEKGQSIVHAETAKTREQHGLGEYQKEAENFEKWDKEAGERIEKGEMPDVISKLEKGDTPSPVEQRMMGKYIATLSEKVEADPSNENLLSLKKAVELSDRMGGSEVGKSLVARKGTFLADDSLANMYVKKMEASGVDELTDVQKEQVQKQHTKLTEANEQANLRIQELESKLAEIELDKTVKSVKRTKKTSEDYKAQRKDIAASIKEKWAAASKDNTLTAVPIPYAKQLAAIAPDVTKMVASYVDEGITNLGEVIKKVHSELKQGISEITEKDVQDIIAGVYREKKKTRNELVAKMRDLRDEAKLMNELDRLEKNEPKEEKKKVQRNQRITELKKIIKEPKYLENSIKKNIEQADKIQEKISKGDFEKTVKSNSIWDNKELQRKYPELYKKALDAQVRKEDAKHEFEIELYKDEQSKRGKFRKVLDFAKGVVATSKAIVSSVDNSAVFVQNAIPFMGHPELWIKLLKRQAIDFWSEKAFKRDIAKLHNSSLYPIIEKSGLDVLEPQSVMAGKKEEYFSDNLLDKTIKIGGKEFDLKNINFTKPFERMFTSLGNNLRVSLFAKKVEELQNQGKTIDKSLKDYKDAARVINELTGRGKSMQWVEKITPNITPVIWSPKLMASTFNILGLGEVAGKGFYRSLTPSQRLFAAKELAKGIGMGVSIMALSALGGADVDYDPWSVTFGNVKSGEKSYNVFGRYSPYVKTLFQALWGKRKFNGNVDNLDDKKGKSRLGILGGFVRGKLTPFAGAGADALGGMKNYFTHEEMNPINTTTSVVVPMSLQSIKTDLERDGTMSLLTSFLPNFFGIKVSDQRDYNK